MSQNTHSQNDGVYKEETYSNTQTYFNVNGVESGQRETIRGRTENGITSSEKTQEILKPDGTKEYLVVRDDGKGYTTESKEIHSPEGSKALKQ